MQQLWIETRQALDWGLDWDIGECQAINPAGPSSFPDDFLSFHEEFNDMDGELDKRISRNDSCIRLGLLD